MRVEPIGVLGEVEAVFDPSRDPVRSQHLVGGACQGDDELVGVDRVAGVLPVDALLHRAHRVLDLDVGVEILTPDAGRDVRPELVAADLPVAVGVEGREEGPDLLALRLARLASLDLDDIRPAPGLGRCDGEDGCWGDEEHDEARGEDRGRASRVPSHVAISCVLETVFAGLRRGRGFRRRRDARVRSPDGLRLPVSISHRTHLRNAPRTRVAIRPGRAPSCARSAAPAPHSSAHYKNSDESPRCVSATAELLLVTTTRRCP